MSGRFITFEGGEGGGKTTQSARLAASLEAAGIETVTTREPGGAPGAEEIRGLLVSGAVDRWAPMAEVLLNYAARETHLTDKVRPALDRGAWVISDRFADSTMAYQGYGGGVDKSRIRAIDDAVLAGFKPDLTIILDLPVEEGLKRAGKRIQDGNSAEDRFERKGRAFHQRLRDGFLAIAAEAPARCAVIDAAADEQAVAARIRAIVAERLEVQLT